jgi:Disintegrin
MLRDLLVCRYKLQRLLPAVYLLVQCQFQIPHEPRCRSGRDAVLPVQRRKRLYVHTFLLFQMTRRQSQLKLPGSLMTSQTNTTCLLDPDPNRQVITLQMCGNGIVEQGEQCDPGLGVTSPCCDSTTCQFLPGAECDPASSPCCTGQCEFAPSTQVCRPAQDPQCDTAEMCTGNSSSCPPDLFASNGRCHCIVSCFIMLKGSDRTKLRSERFGVCKWTMYLAQS